MVFTNLGAVESRLLTLVSFYMPVVERFDTRELDVARVLDDKTAAIGAERNRYRRP